MPFALSSVGLVRIRNINTAETEVADVPVKLQPRSQEVLGSNLDRVIGYPE
jgi:hypothetical protein